MKRVWFNLFIFYKRNGSPEKECLIAQAPQSLWLWSHAFIFLLPWCLLRNSVENHSTTQSYLCDNGQGLVRALDNTRGKAGQSLEEWGRGGDQGSLARRSWEGIQQVYLNHWLKQKRMGLTDDSFHILNYKVSRQSGWCHGGILARGPPSTPHMMSATNYFASSCGNNYLFLSFN